MWQKWSMRVRFDAREGMILHDVSFNHGGSQRPILHRASMPEMSVPYAETQAPFHRRQAFGESSQRSHHLSSDWIAASAQHLPWTAEHGHQMTLCSFLQALFHV